MIKKGIILAGGNGSRLYPLTKSVSKQLLPVYDKPMIYYPLSILMLSKIKDILIISKKTDQILYKNILGDGKKFGIKLNYAVQENPNGIPEAFIIGEKFIQNNKVVLILGDNILYGQNIQKNLIEASNNKNSTIFAYRVNNPAEYGVVQFDNKGKILQLKEKPKKKISNYAIPGIYFYDKNIVNYAKKLKKSKRGELEIVDINKIYLKKKKLQLKILSRGISWFDAGAPEQLLEASEFVRVIEKRQGFKIACLEEIALRNKWISIKNFRKSLSNIAECEYKDYLKFILNEKDITYSK